MKRPATPEQSQRTSSVSPVFPQNSAPALSLWKDCESSRIFCRVLPGEKTRFRPRKNPPFPLRAVESVEKCAWECFCEGAKSRPVVVPHIGIRPMDSAAAPATRSPMLSPPVAIATPLKNKPAPPAAATGLKPSCGVLCEIFSRFSLTIPRWLFTSSIRRSEPGKPLSRGRHHSAGSARSRGVQWPRSGLLVVDGLSAEARPPIVRGFQAVR